MSVRSLMIMGLAILFSHCSYSQQPEKKSAMEDKKNAIVPTHSNPKKNQLWKIKRMKCTPAQIRRR